MRKVDFWDVQTGEVEWDRDLSVFARPDLEDQRNCKELTCGVLYCDASHKFRYYACQSFSANLCQTEAEVMIIKNVNVESCVVWPVRLKYKVSLFIIHFGDWCSFRSQCMLHIS